MTSYQKKLLHVQNKFECKTHTLVKIEGVCMHAQQSFCLDETLITAESLYSKARWTTKFLYSINVLTMLGLSSLHALMIGTVACL